MAALLASLLLPGVAPAGQRHTVWAYPPGAGPKGSVEVETWLTGTKETSASPTDSEYRIEIENGLTDDVSLDVYLGVLTQTQEEGLRFNRIQASLRANVLPDRMRDLIDLTGYFEVTRDVEWSNPWGFEAILIAGKSYGRFGLSMNLVVESDLSSRAFASETTEWQGIATAGYELTHSIWAGAEFIAANDRGKHEVSLGPTVSVVLTPKTWVAIGPQFGLNGSADRLQVRAIFGIFF
ncbi:MAG: hypothetical protein ACHQPI_13535 [Thermoanaerobaculia bacterium]